MNLVAIWGLKTSDHDWLNTFWPARRLKDACTNRSIPLRFLFPQEAYLLTEPQANRPFSKSDTICLLRGRLPAELPALLENAGWRCINSARSTSLANDKLASFLFFSQRGFRVPHTQTIDISTMDTTTIQTWPIVIKPRFGSRGEGVELVQNKQELASIIKLSGSFIAQEYIAESAGRDLRVFFAGGRVLASVIRTGAPGSFLSNASAGGTMQLINKGSKDIENGEGLALEIAALSGLFYGTADFLFAGPEIRDGLILCEINAAPGFEALERLCGIDIAGPLIDALATIPVS